MAGFSKMLVTGRNQQRFDKKHTHTHTDDANTEDEQVWLLVLETTRWEQPFNETAKCAFEVIQIKHHNFSNEGQGKVNAESAFQRPRDVLHPHGEGG